MVGDDETISDTVNLLLKGDAVQRTIAAASLSWQPAVNISGSEWQPPLLAHLLEDPYSAVRYVAYRSLKTFAGFEDFEYDFVASEIHRTEARIRAMAIWNQQRSDREVTGKTLVLIGPDGELLQSELKRLTKLRNDRKLTLSE